MVSNTPLKFWKHYVDDTCAALPVSSVQQFLDHLNGVEPSIQFTVELESDGKLPFLDVLLQRDPDGSIATTVYRKPPTQTAQGRSNLLGRTAKDRETRHIKRALINNGYPRGVLQHHTTPAPTRPDDDHSRGPVITLPYVRGLSEAV